MPGPAANYTDVDLIRQEAKNERQLRRALKLYWETEKKTRLVLPNRRGGAGGGRVAGKFWSSRNGSAFLTQKQSQQVIENTEKVSGIGQNKAKSTDGEEGETDKWGQW